MKTKVIAFVIVMISLCSCLAFSNGLSAEKVFKVFVSMYSPGQAYDSSKNVMSFGDENNQSKEKITIAEENITLNNNRL